MMTRALIIIVYFVATTSFFLPFSFGWLSSIAPQFPNRETKKAHSFRLHVTSNNQEKESAVATRTPVNHDGSFGWSDEEFQSWILQELILEAPTLYQDYSNVFVKASHCITRWRQRFRGNIPLWKRIFKKERVLKEVIDSIPIIHAVDHWISSQNNVTIVDLCSGKGYLSMMLSEYLPPDRVEKCILIDKAWPTCHTTPQPHHMNWEHIYGNCTETNETYFTTWPIPLHTSKQDLKKTLTLRQLEKRFQNQPGPILVLAVHLCGTLSIQAVQLFHQIPNVQTLLLKPCCLPAMLYQHRQEEFTIGSRYSFPTKDVCAAGKWSHKEWVGPPRWHLQDRFQNWCYHLHEGMNDGDHIQTKLMQVQVQSQGGYQNTFLLAEKQPITNAMWEGIE
jgi:hypothetical protein